MTATEKALKAKAEMESLFQSAIDEQLAIISEAENRLAELGYNGKKPKKTTRNTDASKRHCELCDMAGHDIRAHRSQGDNKKKFTQKELTEKGLA